MNRLFLWRILLLIGVVLSFIALILGWIGFGVPQWHQFRRYTSSDKEYYGLWSYCQDQNVTKVCQRWPTAEKELYNNGTRPHYVSITEALITMGMILLTLGLLVAVIAALIPLLVFLGAAIGIFSFILLLIGLPVFGREANSLSKERGDVQYTHRYGFWLFVPVIILEFLATMFWIGAGILYELYGFGNVSTRGYYTLDKVKRPGNGITGKPRTPMRPTINRAPSSMYQSFASLPSIMQATSVRLNTPQSQMVYNRPPILSIPNRAPYLRI